MNLKTRVIIDTDIGTDVDDAFAIAFAFRAHLNILGISTVSGDTLQRAAIVSKMGSITEHSSIPVFAGASSRAPMIYSSWAHDHKANDIKTFDEMVDFYWTCIQSASQGDPLVILALGPMTNLQEVREIDPVVFDARVIVHAMCGSIKRGYGGLPFPTPEYNIVADKDAARAIFSSNVPLTIVPLDVTWNLKLNEVFFGQGGEHQNSRDELIGALQDMSRAFKKHVLGHRDPILFDVATVATFLTPALGQYSNWPLHVNRLGFTRLKRENAGSGKMTTTCTALDKEAFFKLFFEVLHVDV